MNHIRHAASKLKSKYKFSTPTSDDISKIIRDSGYTIIEFNPAYNDKNTETIISSLNLSREISRYKAFTFHNADYRFVFLITNLSEKEKCILLAHELGHIELKHSGQNILMGQNIQQEQEANEFSHYLLTADILCRLRFIIKKHLNKIVLFLSTVLFLLTVLVLFSVIQKDSPTEYYITPNGGKYHRKGCYHINPDTAHKINKNELNTNEYDPCKTCLPDQK